MRDRVVVDEGEVPLVLLRRLVRLGGGGHAIRVRVMFDWG